MWTIKKETLTAICNNIRVKLGVDKKYSSADIPECVNEVYEAGQQAEYDRFWDNYQNYGKRTNYYVAFMYSYWNNDNFKPKYPLKPTDLNNCFASSGIRGDFTKLCDLDTSNCTNMSSAFGYMTGLTRLGVLDLQKVTTGTAFCTGCTNLETIDKVIFKDDGSWRISNCNGCTSLKNIQIEGKMGGGNISFSQSPLTPESMKSIINSLYDYSGTGTTYTLTLGTTNLAKLSDGEKAVATQKGWTLA